MSSTIRLSVSKINRYLSCPAQDRYVSDSDVPEREDYPLLRGKEIHRMIDFLHRPLGESSEPRPFYYQSKLSAIRQWFRRWQEALREAAPKLLRVDKKEAERNGKAGAACISQYWDSFYHWPQPLERESPYQYPWPTLPGVMLTGRFDQVRNVSTSWVEAHRPEIVRDGQLIPGYDPVVIVDFKSNYESYDPFRHLHYREEIILNDQVLWQLPLHLDYQPAVYTWFYHMIHGRRPVGFIWWHFLTGKGFFTYRTDEDYDELELVVKHVVYNLAANSFPRRPSSGCRRCLVYDVCWGPRPFLVASAEPFPEGSALRGAIQEAPNMVKRVAHQLPLKLGVRRRKIEARAALLPVQPEVVTLGSAPRPELQNVELDLKPAE